MDNKQIQVAKNKILSQKYSEAYDILEKLYQEQSGHTFEVNHLLTVCLVALKKYDEAYDNMGDFLEDYLSQKGYLNLFLEVAVKLGKVLACYRLQDFLPNDSSREYLLKQMDVLCEQEYAKQREQNTLKELKYLGSKSIFEQLRFTDKLESVRPQKSKNLLLNIVRDEDVDYFVRMMLLEKLQENRELTTVEVRGMFDENISVDMEIVRNIWTLENRCKEIISSDNILTDNVKNLFMEQASVKIILLFPYISELSDEQLLMILKEEIVSDDIQVKNLVGALRLELKKWII